MLDFLNQIDLLLFQFMNGFLSNPFFDWIMPIITDPQNWVLPLLAYIVFALGFDKKRGRIAFVLLILAIALVDSIAGHIIKPAFGRLRPSHALEGINLLVGKGGKYGFVSNHAANMFALSVILGYFYPKAKHWLTSLACMIGFSRIYVGVHYPGDVLFGGLFGYTIAWSILTVWVLVKMRELKKGKSWVWYADDNPPEIQ